MSGKLAWVERLTSEDRKAYVFMLAYQKARRAVQGGFTLGSVMEPEIVLKPTFKQCRTVVTWLEKQGWKITWREVHWQGYLKHAFASMAPTVPLPGQLRNWRLLRAYLASVPDQVVPARSEREMHDLYQKVLRPEIARDGSWQASLGLRPPPE